MVEQKCSVTDIIPKCLELLTPVFGVDALLEAREIISMVCGISPLTLSINPDDILLSSSDKNKILNFCHRRTKHEPLQYITGKAFFMHDEFKIGPGVLIPRGDTERLVEKALEVAQERFYKNGYKVRFLEFCTGSGCAGISLIRSALKLGIHIKGVATDISNEALMYARANATDLGVKEHFKIIQHDIFSGDYKSLIQDDKTFDIIIANPPYISTEEINSLAPEVQSFEPIIALDGGADGLKFYEILSKLAIPLLGSDGVIISEIGYDQALTVKKIFSRLNAFSKIDIFKDYSGNPRIIQAQK